MKHSLPQRQTAVALGNFDGIHVGHRAILSACVQCAKNEGLESVVWSFRRHPEEILLGKNAPGTILPVEEKERLVRALGADRLVLEEFEAVRSLSPEAFCERILIDTLRAKKVFCGFNFRFGKNGAGDAHFLKEYLSTFGVETVIADPVCADGAPVSSTRIRALLKEGDVKGAARLLGRPYSISFPVSHGKMLGRKIGFPTANQIYPPTCTVPKKGVYAVSVLWNGSRFDGICNVGSRPTVDQDTLSIAETYLIDFDFDLYGQCPRVEFLEFLRPETKFDSVEELQQQIARDLESLSTRRKEQS